MVVWRHSVRLPLFFNSVVRAHSWPVFLIRAILSTLTNTSVATLRFWLCTGRPLFAADTSDDEILSVQDSARLCSWNNISDAELNEVFSRKVCMRVIHRCMDTCFDGIGKQLLRGSTHGCQAFDSLVLAR